HRPTVSIGSFVRAVCQAPDIHDLLHGFEPPVAVGTADRAVHAAGGAQRVAQRVRDDGERPGGFAPLPRAEKLRRPREGVADIEVVRVDDGKRAADRGRRRQHRMARAPRLRARRRHGQAGGAGGTGGDVVEPLDCDRRLDPVERRRELRPGDHDDRPKARTPRVEDAVIEQRGAGWPDPLALLGPAVATADAGRQDHERGRADWPYLAGSSLARACSTTRRTPSASGMDARQSQVRRATAGSSEIRAMSPRRSPAWVGPLVYPVAAATSRNSSRSETSRPHATLATIPEGPPPAARSVASTTSPT